MKKLGTLACLLLFFGYLFATQADSLIQSLSHKNERDKVNQLMS